MGQTHSNRMSNNKPIPQNNGSHKHSTRSKTDKKLLKIPTHTVPQPRNVSVQNVREPCFLKMPSLELKIYSIDPMIRKLFNRPKIRENSLSWSKIRKLFNRPKIKRESSLNRSKIRRLFNWPKIKETQSIRDQKTVRLAQTKRQFTSRYFKETFRK